MKSLLRQLLLQSLVSAFVPTTKFFRAFEILCPPLHSNLHKTTCFETNDSTSVFDRFEQLCEEVSVQPAGLLRLDESKDGVRGLYLNRAVKAGDMILSIPLNKCIRDDQELPFEITRYDDDDNSTRDADQRSWALRLAIHLAKAQEAPYQTHHSLWFSLLPDAAYLKASLPVHWDDEVVQSTMHTAFTMAVDSAYFTRATALQSINTDIDLNAALDIVQTRTCRVETSKGDPLRLLAPVFDFFNHASPSTAAFELENNDETLVVRATVDLLKDQQVCIDYGPSTKPAWQSLISYGFIAENDEELAEVYLDGVRYEVGPEFIPEDMVLAATSFQSSQSSANDPVHLTPEIATFLARRISDVAYHYLLAPPPPPPPPTTTTTTNEDNDDDDESDVPMEKLIAMRLASSLRWNQHRILLKCATNLHNWSAQQSAEE